MKLKLLALMLIGCIVTGCVDTIEISEPDVEYGESGKGNPVYLCISLSGAAIGSTRDDNGPEFEDGNESESKVKNVAFYFFDGDGKVVKVKNARNTSADNSYGNYYNWTPSDGSVNKPVVDDNIEETITALLVADFEDRKIPAQVLAIVNPNDSVIKLSDPSLGVLQSAVFDFETGLTHDNFVMSNSSYIQVITETDENGLTTKKSQKIVSAVPINESNIGSSPQGAETVNISVERVVARLDLAFVIEEEKKKKVDQDTIIYKTDYKIKPDETESEAEIYVKFLGWSITSTPKTSRLLKKIDDNWAVDEFFNGNSSWNDEKNWRSYWAINPEFPENADSKEHYRWFSFNEISGLDSQEKTRSPYCYQMTEKKAYMQENANPYKEGHVDLKSPDYPSEVIAAAQLVDKDNKPVEIAEYGSERYTLDSLKNRIANSLDMYYYVKNEENGPVIRKKIEPRHLTFETSMHRNDSCGPDEVGTYYSYFILTEEAQAIKEWYHDCPNIEDKESYKISDAQAYIDEMVYPAKVWKNGYTYYYFKIPHCQDVEKTSPGYYGVIRNNIYDAKIKEITGLGTPVYDPEETIYPETPENEDNQLKVTVEKMQWRRISQNVPLWW